MKKTVSVLLAGMLLFGTAAAVCAEDALTAHGDEIVNLVNYAEIIGENSSAAEPMIDAATPTCPEYAFDGDITTLARGGYGLTCGGVGKDGWVGIYLEQPAVLTTVRYATCDYNKDGLPDRIHAIFGQTVEGSNDGENWDFIYRYTEDDYIDYLENSAAIYHTKELSCDKAYTYYRIWNVGGSEGGVSLWGEVEFHGILVDEEDSLDYIKGDLNADEDIDILDALLLCRCLMMPELYNAEDYYVSTNFDFNGDGVTDIQDARYLFLHGVAPDAYPL